MATDPAPPFIGGVPRADRPAFPGCLIRRSAVKTPADERCAQSTHARTRKMVNYAWPGRTELALWDEPNAELRRLNRRSLETRKGVGCYRQQGGGHGSRTSAKECVTTHLPKQLALKMDAAEASCLCSAVSGRVGCPVRVPARQTR
ncbi:hypothetical protein M8J77_025932 [Diaphorina citri]|nr:hypothetical protein M8J77_025283 [Diaphorina citri]KAI5697911.1 hypothetical protein M8J77_005607 [Diaphorina citri]KAI5702262.1 hypothetical protein M8J77_025932 [Diaphorina citri]